MKPNYKFHTGKLERIAGAIQITSRYFSVSEWNKLSNLSRQSENIQKIKNTLMKDVKSNEQLLFAVHDIQGVKLFS